MRFPSIKEVATKLTHAKYWLDGEVTDTDVRLQVYEDGRWALRTGDSSYDQDHSGFWGCSFLDRRTNARETARDLIDQCREDYAEYQSAVGLS